MTALSGCSRLSYGYDDAYGGSNALGGSFGLAGAPGASGTPAVVSTGGALSAAGTAGAAGSSAGVPVVGSGGTGGAAMIPSTPKTCEASYEAETMTPSTGEAVEQGWNIYTQGTLSGTHTFKGGSAKVTVFAKGSAAAGVWPHIIVRVGSSKVGELHVETESWAPYEFMVSPPAGEQAIQIEFTNDAIEDGSDRNVYIDKVQVTETCDGSNGSVGGGGSSSNGETPGASGGSGGTGSGSGGANSGGAFMGTSSEKNLFASLPIYVDPANPAVKAEQALRSSGNTADADLMKKLATSAQSDWIGEWVGEPGAAVRSALEAAGNSVRVLVAYNIYNRDCGGASGGGASDANAYKSWIDAFASGIGPRNVAIILEPDALSHECDPSRWETLSYAVSSLKKNPGARVYIDAGHSNWVDAGTMASRLRTAGIDKADGFALNVSNFQTTQSSIGFGSQLSGQVGNKPFVIDTSRNGKGPAGGEWCNPSGRGLGEKPTGNTGNPLVHAFLWIKRPGESDGPCNGGPAAGEWFQSYALELARNAVF